MSEYRKAKKGIEVSVGESVRILRELQEMSQNDLATATGMQAGNSSSGFPGDCLKWELRASSSSSRS